jgi:hypothetical protein
MMQQSETIGHLATALAEAQSEIENAIKNAKNPHFKNNYADLAEVINTVRPTLTKHGLAFIQLPGYEAEFGVVTVTTVLTHKSGEWISGVAGAPAPKKDPQGVGSAVTYLRRYALAALTGIAQEDDDGETASRREAKREEEHADLLRQIGAAKKDNPKLPLQIGGRDSSLEEYLTANASTVKGVMESARELVRAINRSKESAETTAAE